MFNRQQTVVCTQDDCKNENTGNFKGCLLPNNPLHGKYFVSDQSEIYIPGNYASQSMILSLTCDNGYVANPSEASQYVCLDDGQWFPTLGTCIVLLANVVGVSENVNKSTIPPLPDVSNHKNLKLLPTSDCGIYPIKKRIINGEKADLFEFPWMALLSYRSDIDFLCGGTIINDRYILTAANCLTSSREPVEVRVGEYNLSSEPDCEIEGDNISVCADPVQDIEIEEIIIHHNYMRRDQSNDIGLLRLRSPIQFKRSVRPICLPITEEFKFENIANSQLIITGWGASSLHGDGDGSAELLKAKVSIVSEMECKDIYKNLLAVINHRHLCAGGKEGDSCSGDSGGPLQGAKVVNDDIRYVQYDITSFGASCGIVAGVYTRIDYFLNWILDNIKI